MSDKYTIKNCEQIHSADNFCWSKNVLCQDYSDCLLKRIVGKCKKTVKIFSAESGTQPYAGGRCTEAEGILKLLDIQEVE